MPKVVAFTDEQVNQIVKMYNDGKLIKEIAPLFNTSNSTIARRLRDAGVISRHPSISSEREELAVEYYKQYRNLSTVGRLIHMNPGTVKSILNANGIHTLTASEVKRTKHINEQYFDNIDSHRKAYYLGLLYADGTISSTSNRVQISLQERDAYILESLKKDLATDYKLSFIPYNQKNPNWQNQYCLTISNEAVHDALISHGVIPCKSLTLTFPKINEMYYSSFILGYMDGDGHISGNPKDKRCNLVSTESFCTSVADILKDTLDVNCSVMLCHGKTEVTTRMLQVAGGRQVKKFLDWIYSDCDIYMERKYAIYQKLYS